MIIFGDIMILDDIAVKLEGTVYIGQTPDLPDNITVLNITGGTQTRHSMGNPNIGYENRTISVKVRNLSFIDGYNLCERQCKILDNICYYNNILALIKNGSISDVGRDDRQRYIFLISYTALVEI